LVTMANLANRLWSQGDNGGNPRRTDTLGQLIKRHGSEYDSCCGQGQSAVMGGVRIQRVRAQ